MLASGVFRGAGRPSSLLRFLVQETLEGRADRLKDYTLGAEVLGRGEDFDPRTDPIARVEASRLRARLDLYYATEGAGDAILISLPKGGYVPQFECRAPVSTEPAARAGRERLTWAVLAVASLVALGEGWWIAGHRADRPASAEVRLELTTPATTDPQSIAISPDGRKLVYAASVNGVSRLWLRPLDGSSARELAGTDHATLPFWAPDSQSLGFFADSVVKRIDLATGLIRTLGRAAVPAGGAWGPDGTVIFPMVPDSPLYRVPAGGGEQVPLTVLGPEETGHRGPAFLPDGRHFLYYVMGTPDARGVHVADIGGGPSRRLVEADAPAVYSPSGHLLYVSQGTLFTQRLDPARLELVGTPHPIAAQIVMGGGAGIAALSASAAGPIVYRTGGSAGARQLVWFDRSGRALEKVGAPQSGPAYASMSPDGRRLARQETTDGNTDIWLIDLQGGRPIRFTTSPSADIAPAWSPTGDRIGFSSKARSAFDLYEQKVDSPTSEPLLATDQAKQITDWSADGRLLLFRSLDPELDWDLWALSLDGDRKPFPVVRTKFEERDGQFSPDGRWVAYESNESGRFEIYVQPFPGPGERSRISTNGGVQVRWRSDGRELFYLDLDGRLMAVPIAAGRDDPSPEAGAPVPLFVAPVGAVQDVALFHYLVADDGRRFLMDTLVEQPAPPISVILNWAPPPD